ncbi:MAG: Na+/H+ antiporter subunit C [Bacteroidales bacterium]|nr:Na+/H+ antiporter subunit C [Bacteroidales bacterium]MDP2236208.1 Na+/H+ antiporter subunit C [Bacteroidales bacterium]
MEFLLAILIGGLFSAAIYMILRRSIIKLIIGLSFLAHAANLLIFTLGRVIRGKAPLIQEGSKHITETVADPLPQALILTAIVIGFGVTAFTIVLIQQVYQSVGVDDSDKLKASDQ